LKDIESPASPNITETILSTLKNRIKLNNHVDFYVNFLVHFESWVKINQTRRCGPENMGSFSKGPKSRGQVVGVHRKIGKGGRLRSGLEMRASF
jgi:hypothetical protein